MLRNSLGSHLATPKKFARYSNVRVRFARMLYNGTDCTYAAPRRATKIGISSILAEIFSFIITKIHLAKKVSNSSSQNVLSDKSCLLLFFAMVPQREQMAKDTTISQKLESYTINQHTYTK